MARGVKTGGRVKGTPNKSTEVRDFVAAVEKRLEKRSSSLDERAEVLLFDADSSVVQKTWAVIMAYKYGKPMQPISGGPQGSEPIRIVIERIGAVASSAEASAV